MSDKVTLVIQNQKFVFWQTVRITRAIDSINSIDLSAPFDHTAPRFKEMFKPFAYNPIIVSVDDEPLFTGRMVDIDPDLSTDSKKISVTGYSSCGFLQDCTAPPEAMPLEFNNLTLKQIAEKLASFFKINVDFRGDPGAAFSRVACDPDKKIFEFLTELAKQRGFVISSNVRGDVLFWKSGESTPVARLEQGVSPLMDVTPAFNPQDYYTDLTGLSPIEVKKPPAKKTVKTKKDPKDKAKTEAPKQKVKQPKPATKYSKFSVDDDDAVVYRPLVFKIDDVEGVDIETAVKAKQARMLGNMAAYDIQVSTWRDQSGELWEPNTRISLKAPDAMIYDFYEFEIRAVAFEGSENSRTATLSLSLPGSFSGEPPEVFPWEL
ncbi:MAG: hypothetical protein RR182_01040 [Alistipes sp.]